jgi:hypothetical protein
VHLELDLLAEGLWRLQASDGASRWIVRVRRHAHGVLVVVTDAPDDADGDLDADTDGDEADLVLQPAGTAQPRNGLEIRCADLRVSLIDAHDNEIARAFCTDVHVRHSASAATTAGAAAAAVVDNELDVSLGDLKLFNPLLGTRFPLACAFASPSERPDDESSASADAIADGLACLHVSARWTHAPLDSAPPALSEVSASAAEPMRSPARRAARRVAAAERRRMLMVRHLILLAQPFEVRSRRTASSPSLWGGSESAALGTVRCSGYWERAPACEGAASCCSLTHSGLRNARVRACVRQLAIDEEQLLRALEELLRIAAQMRPEGEPSAAAADAALLAPKV